jgi:predicted carbohydrate-binding protein with CBM5 and CBM33 domain
MKVIYCIVAREDSKGVFYTIDTVRKGGVGGSAPFDQKPNEEEVKNYLLSVYPEMTESVHHINYSQSPDEIASIYF